MQETTFPEWLPPLIMIPIIVLIIFAVCRRKKKRKDSGILTYCGFPHVNGLPIAENMFCEIRSYIDRIEFKSGAVNIKLPREKIVDMCVKTDTDIQNQLVSSAGGAIAGGLLFGPLGAMIGGRAKTKAVKTVTYYLIITYTNDGGDLAYIGFDVKNNAMSASKLVREFKNFNQNSNVQISL